MAFPFKNHSGNVKIGSIMLAAGKCAVQRIHRQIAVTVKLQKHQSVASRESGQGRYEIH